MLAFDRRGCGPPLVLLHGTNSSRSVWAGVVPELRVQRDVIVIDLPAHGNSPATSFTPPDFAGEISGLFDDLGLHAPAVVGHSVGGWTALELAKLGRAGAVLALAPAGLWRKRSPLMTDINLRINWRMGRLLGDRVEPALRSRLGRRVCLHSISARPQDVLDRVAVEAARTAIASKHFPEHFRQTRVLRFEGGERIPAAVPITVIWGDEDRVALARRSRFEHQLPPHKQVETWRDCGHMVMWDRQRETIAAALATVTAEGTS